MKKLLVILLAIACAFTMFSCGDEESSASLSDFSKAVKNTNPTVSALVITTYTQFGPLTTSYLTTYAADGTFAIKYSIEKFNAIETGEADEVISVTEGTVNCDANGNYTDGGSFTGSVADAQGAKLNLTGKKMTYKISNGGSVLTATIKAANTVAVLGTEYASDVTLVLTRNGDKIISYTLSYAIESGSVKVTCSYN
jgi:hypothetical protein